MACRERVQDFNGDAAILVSLSPEGVIPDAWRGKKERTVDKSGAADAGWSFGAREETGPDANRMNRRWSLRGSGIRRPIEKRRRRGLGSHAACWLVGPALTFQDLVDFWEDWGNHEERRGAKRETGIHGMDDGCHVLIATCPVKVGSLERGTNWKDERVQRRTRNKSTGQSQHPKTNRAVIEAPSCQASF